VEMGFPVIGVKRLTTVEWFYSDIQSRREGGREGERERERERERVRERERENEKYVF